MLFRRSLMLLNPCLRSNSRFLIQRPRYYFGDQRKENPLSDLDQKPPLTKDEVKETLKGQEPEEEEDISKRSNVLLYSFGAIGLMLGYVFMQITQMGYQNKSKPVEMTVKHKGKAQIGGPWKLLTTDGRVMTDQDLRGSYYMIYFGFCNCPDICPASLLKLSKALQRIRQLPEGKLFNLKTIFVSVDPDRDSGERVERFLSHFDKSIIGLRGRTNDDPELKEAMRNFKIYASKIKFQQEDEKTKQTTDEYTIDHTIITYLMDSENNYVTHLGSNLGEFDLARIIVEKILENEREKMQN
ncbi:unnamed protein product [Paramecium pentaurelia]|uniref:Uncharacterized protein n=1 Tax=Paramecium pentaurelia TaxID=43138 RepID=A0A8S1S0Q0_9CILI|nr:unnamed protein product [Paramecium pentaurelia]